MKEIIKSDYYPVHLDFADLIKSASSAQSSQYPYADSVQQIHKLVSIDSPAIFDAEELADLALESGFSVFQTVVLLLKNAFEGHVFLTYNIRPDRLYTEGTMLFQEKPEFMLLSFYQSFQQYNSYLNQIWKQIQGIQEDLSGISFDLLLHTIIFNQLIRFPVSLFSTYDIKSFIDFSPMSKPELIQNFELVMLGEEIMQEFEFTERINSIYANKFKEIGQQIRIKEDVYIYYQRKFELAFYSNIESEEELDKLMYQKLVEERLSSTKNNNETKVCLGGTSSIESPSGVLGIKEKTKVLYRTISKNCSEVHSSVNSDISFPELHQFFLEANSIYNKIVTTPHEAHLQYLHMVSLFSKVLTYRKKQGYLITTSHHLISEVGEKMESISKENLSLLRNDLENNLLTFRIESYTHYKMKFVMDDDFTEIHNHFLQQQIDFMDEQISQLKNDIQQVLKLTNKSIVIKQN